MIYGFITTSTSIALSAIIISWYILDLKKEGIKRYRVLLFSDIIAISVGAAMYFGFQSHYTHFQYNNLFGKPSVMFSRDCLYQNLRNIRNLLGSLSPSKQLWFCFVIYVIGVLIYVFLKGKNNYKLYIVAGLSLCGTMLYMCISKTLDYQSEILFSQIRMYLFVPLLPALLLWFSSLCHTNDNQTALVENLCTVSKSYHRMMVPCSIGIIILSLLASVYKGAYLFNSVKTNSDNFVSDAVLPVISVEQLKQDSENLLQECENNDVDLVIYIPRDDLHAYGCESLLYGEVETYNAFFERRSWIYIKNSMILKEPIKAIFVSDHMEVKTVPPGTSVNQFIYDNYQLLRWPD